MTEFFALMRKQFTDSRWTLGFSAIALFWLSWLFVFITSTIEAQLRGVANEGGPTPEQVVRRLGDPDMELSSAALEVMFWNHPLIYLPLVIWAISRGTAAVSAEIERGTLDLILSRPITRSFYLSANIAFSAAGFVFLVAALVAGNRVAHHYNAIESPPPLTLLLKPAVNLMAVGMAIFSYTILPSSLESVRWRPMLGSSVLTLACLIVHIAVTFPTLERWKYLDNYTIFKPFNPAELVTKGETFGFNMGILTGITAFAIAVAYLGFSRRDLPTSS